MTRFLFNIVKDGAPGERIAAELQSVAQAKVEAVEMLGAELRDHPSALLSDEDWRIEVADERGLILFSVYSSAIDSPGAPSR